MCASYGLDPRFTDSVLLEAEHEAMLEGLRVWAADAETTTRRPTGRHARNLNPLVTASDGAPALEQGWWGFLEGGEPVKFPSINSRAERLRDRPSGMASRAIVPTTGWFEMQKHSRLWHSFRLEDGALFGMAAVTRHARTPDGSPVTCFSIVTRDAAGPLAEVHPRMPLLIPAAFAHEWLAAPAASASLVDAALDAADGLTRRLTIHPGAGP